MNIRWWWGWSWWWWWQWHDDDDDDDIDDDKWSDTSPKDVIIHHNFSLHGLPIYVYIVIETHCKVSISTLLLSIYLLLVLYRL